MPIDADGYFLPRYQTTAWLHALGIRHIDEVRSIGVIEVCVRLRALGYPVTSNMAYGLQGDLMGISWREVPDEVRRDLRREFLRRMYAGSRVR